MQTEWTYVRLGFVQSCKQLELILVFCFFSSQHFSWPKEAFGWSAKCGQTGWKKRASGTFFEPKDFFTSLLKPLNYLCCFHASARQSDREQRCYYSEALWAEHTETSPLSLWGSHLDFIMLWLIDKQSIIFTSEPSYIQGTTREMTSIVYAYKFSKIFWVFFMTG